MRKFIILFCLLFLSCNYAAGNRTGTVNHDHVIIAHFGDSTCMTDYLPPEQMVDAILNVRLKAAYKTSKITNYNLGLSGDSIRVFLDTGRYEHWKNALTGALTGIDIAFIRYGSNDMNHRTLSDYQKDLEELCDRIATDFPGVKIILESNMYEPWYPDSFNNELNDVWEVARQVAKTRDYPFVEVFKRLKREAGVGKKDLCIRNQSLSLEKFGRRIVDDIVDKEMAKTPDWFKDGHPNYNAVKLIADEELKLLIALWPKKLPKAAAN